MTARRPRTEQASVPARAYGSPIGPLWLEFAGPRLAAIRAGRCPGQVRGAVGDMATGALAERVVAALDAYFRGCWDALRGLPLAPAPTAFQQRFRRALGRVGAGRTLSYAELAARLGTSPRAAGRACACNPLPLVLPCHRVVASDGRLGGYSLGAGVRHKRWLLRHEGVRV